MILKRNENIKTNINELEIAVEKEIFAQAVDRAYKKEIKKIRVPGFRIGKAPKKVVEKIYGEDVFYEEAINSIYKKVLDDAIRESKLDVVGVENFKLIYASEEKGLCFTIYCILKPEVEVKSYKGIEVKKTLKKISEKDVANRISALKERVARIINVEKDTPAKKGDLVSIDYMGFVDGISFKGGSAKNYSLKLGSNQFVKGFEEQIVGHKISDEFEVEVTFPKDYHAQELKEKKALFKCKLNSIKKIELPKEDDEFAKDVSEFETLKELKENIKKTLKKANEDSAQNAIEQKLMSVVVENVSGDIPQVMFDNKFEELLKDFEMRIKNRGYNLKSYFDVTGVKDYVLEHDLKMQAEFQVKLELALEKIVKLENLKVEEKEIDKEMEEYAKRYNMDLKNIKRIFPVEILKKDILRKKAIEFIKNNAKIKNED